MSYARFASPLRRLKPITRRPIPQVSIGLHSRGGSTAQSDFLAIGVVFGGKGHPSCSFAMTTTKA